MSGPHIGWAGVGKLGAPMAERVIAAGFDLTVFDASPKATAGFKGRAHIATSLAELAGLSDIVVTTIPNDEVLQTVSSEILSVLEPTRIYVDMSTVSPPASAEVAQAAAAHRVNYLRAPVSGSVAHAEKGILTVLCSGPREAFETAAPIFEAFSAHIYHVGDAEEARYLKLVINNLVGSTATLLAESLALGRKGGLDWGQMLEVIGNSAVASPLVKYKVDPLTARDFSPAFTTTQMIKDISLVVDAARAAGCDTPLASQTLAILEDQAKAGMGDEDFTAAVKVLEARAGLPNEV